MTDMEQTPAIKFSEQQERAVALVRDWLVLRNKPIFRLFGYAGTGKTTIARELAATHDGPVFFAAFTGKAASVLRSKGCKNACTIHQLAYKVEEKEGAIDELRAKIRTSTDPERLENLNRQLDEMLQPEFTLRRQRVDPDALIVVDECSMVDEEIGRDLLALGIPILVLGDPAQLPPVSGGGFFTEHEPDILLDQIHRHEAGSGVLELATFCRTNKSDGLRFVTYGQDKSQVLSLRAHGQSVDPNDFDQVLVGRNATRRMINAKIRRDRGLTSKLPMAGDKVQCQRNDFQTHICNGEIFKVLGCLEVDEHTCSIDIQGDDGSVRTVTSMRHYFEGRESELRMMRPRGMHMDWGHAITVHKSQGSQWNRVLLYNESSCFRPRERADDPNTPWRWLYTGITRAAKHVTVLQ